MTEIPEWVSGPYIALADNCYYVDSASYIARLNPPENYRLNPQATLVARFLFMGVHRETVATILADHFNIDNNEAAETVDTVIRGLFNPEGGGEPLIKAGIRPNLRLESNIKLSTIPAIDLSVSSIIGIRIVPVS